MISYNVGDRLTHATEGEGTILRTDVGPKKNLLDVLFDEGAGIGKFIEKASKYIEAVNSVAVSRRLMKWRPTNYVDASSRDFSSEQYDFLKNFVIRITYRPHPYNFSKFVSDYERVTGSVCPLKETNRHESAYSDCAEVYFSSHPPQGLFEFSVKQDGEQWFTENVGLAWVLFKSGFSLSVPYERVAGVA